MTNTKNLTLIVPCQSGLETVVKRQLENRLGYTDCKAINGRIEIASCNFDDIASLNIFLRSGERVLLKLATFACTTFDQLFDNMKAIAWENFLEQDCKIMVITKSVKSTLFAHHSIQGVGKKAIVDRLHDRFKTTLPESGTEFTIEIDLQSDIATISLDTTGDGLFKRGYRTLAYTAPLKETTASGLVDLTVWQKDRVFTDIFCGSGTLPIEAAMKALNIAPGINRRFAFCDWRCVDGKHFEQAQQKARDLRCDSKLQIFASDISADAISIAQYHAKRAGVDKHIKWKVADAAEFTHDQGFGVNVSNIPYGQRQLDEVEADNIAKMLGGVYKKLDNWNFYILTSNQKFERRFCKTADRKCKIYNGGIMCSFYSFHGKRPIKGGE